MKVFLLLHDDGDDYSGSNLSIEGVFSSRELAEDRKAKLCAPPTDADVQAGYLEWQAKYGPVHFKRYVARIHPKQKHPHNFEIREEVVDGEFSVWGFR